MPLYLHKYLQPEGELGIWKIEEEESFFLNNLTLFSPESQQLEQLKGRKKLEWLAGRYLLHHMSGRKIRGACLKDEYGKPYVANSLFDISISHSGHFAAVIAAPRAVGIDIQRIVDKIERIAHKYMSEPEMETLAPTGRIAQLHVYWGAKEALYKAYGRRQLDFKTNILIDPFPLKKEGGAFSGHITKEDYQASYLLYYQQIEDYILVYALEDIGDQRIA